MWRKWLQGGNDWYYFDSTSGRMKKIGYKVEMIGTILIL
nr:hypothetical protein [Ligilactobacillus salivarius]